MRQQIGTNSAHYFLWDGNNLLAELDSTGPTKVAEYSYSPGADNPHALIANGHQYYSHRDGLGNVIALTDSAGGLARTYAFEAWGESTGGGSDFAGLDGKDRARFKGALVFGPYEGSLYYMRARWYDAGMGRFLSEDPLGLQAGINPYVFAGNDPVNGSDPTGLTQYLCTVTGVLVYDWGTGTWYDDPLQRSVSCEEIGGGSDPGVSGGGGHGGNSGDDAKKKQKQPQQKQQQPKFLQCTASVAWTNFAQTNSVLFGRNMWSAARLAGTVIARGVAANATGSVGMAGSLMAWGTSSVAGSRMFLGMAFGQVYAGSSGVLVAAGVSLGSTVAVNAALEFGVGLGSLGTGVGSCWR